MKDWNLRFGGFAVVVKHEFTFLFKTLGKIPSLWHANTQQVGGSIPCKGHRL